MLIYLSTILCAAITRIFLRCSGCSSWQPLGKISLTAGSLSTVLIPNRVMAAHTICALTTRRKNSSHWATAFLGFLTTFRRLIKFLNWNSVPPSLADEQLYSRFQMTWKHHNYDKIYAHDWHAYDFYYSLPPASTFLRASLLQLELNPPIVQLLSCCCHWFAGSLLLSQLSAGHHLHRFWN